ncbi:flagellar hook-associated protein 3 [Geothrix limicola]|uniref:Flagellin n=1 Tax=Geothrix limicola TaxID=2927978 RepID=A0ABQ5QIX7_9BACT|nr:flagellin [Geothrix limicola]GLH73979.1 flagellar hook-associated protein 3 [Geothrix limicola]
MSLRTPSTTQTRQTLLDLERTQARLVQNQTRIATGNRLTSPGDDPAAAASILDLGTSMKSNTQFVKQGDAAMGFLTTSEDVVSSAINDVERLQELAVTVSSASAPEIDAIRTSLLGLANTQVQGKYIFAGTQTLGTAAHPLPFEDAAPPAGPINYWGNSGTVNLSVTATTTIATNIPGDTVFFGAGGQGSTTDLFKAVTDLRDGMATNNAALVATATTNLQNSLNNLLKVQTDLGGRQSQLINLKDTLTGFNVNLQDLQNNLQDTDFAKAATEYSTDQTIQSATLNVLAKANKTSLFDYMA